MRNLYLPLILTIAVLTGRVLPQEIVIEPTNGHAQTTNRVTRPQTTDSTPAAQVKQPTTKAEKGDRVAPKRVARKAAPKQTAPVLVENKPPVVSELAKSEVAEPVPPKKQIPERPEWALADTRDPGTLQIEIANALAHDPKLAGSSFQVSVNEGTVTLQGRALGGEAQLEARRLVQSYAWNRKLIEHMNVIAQVSAQK